MAVDSEWVTGQEPVTEAPSLTYRAELRRRSALGTSTYYEAGEFCPYTLDTLIQTVHAESRLSYDSLILKLEIAGGCPQAILDAIARKFARVTDPKVRVIVRSGKQSWMLESLVAHGNSTGTRSSS